MKNVFGWSLIFSLGLVLTAMGCQRDRCAGQASTRIGGEYFTVAYQNETGDNYLDGGYQLSNVEVFIDSTGGLSERPRYVRIQEDLSDGVFGPFFFTDDYIDPATLQPNLPVFTNRPIQFDYFFKKDTFGIDTLRVSFQVNASECATSWTYLHYILNGDTLEQYSGQTEAEIVVVE